MGNVELRHIPGKFTKRKTCRMFGRFSLEAQGKIHFERTVSGFQLLILQLFSNAGMNCSKKR